MVEVNFFLLSKKKKKTEISSTFSATHSKKLLVAIIKLIRWCNKGVRKIFQDHQLNEWETIITWFDQLKKKKEI